MDVSEALFMFGYCLAPVLFGALLAAVTIWFENTGQDEILRKEF